MENTTLKPHWSFWLIAVVSLLWNAMGAVDFTMTQLRVEAYMSEFTAEQIAYFYGFPLWVVATWGIATWFSVIGSLLLLARKKAAVMTLWISFGAMVVTSFHNFVLSETSMADIAGSFALVFSAIIFVVALALAIYARTQARLGVLS
jgi:hypothetical protein